jgi:hypothetical protein
MLNMSLIGIFSRVFSFGASIYIAVAINGALHYQSNSHVSLFYRSSSYPTAVMGSCSTNTLPSYTGSSTDSSPLPSAASTSHVNEERTSTAAQIDGSDRSWESLFGLYAPSNVSNNAEGLEDASINNTALVQATQNTEHILPSTSPIKQPTPIIEPTEAVAKRSEDCQFYQFRDNGEKLTIIVGNDECTRTTIIVSPDVVRNLSKTWETIVNGAKRHTKLKPWQSSFRKRAKERRQVILPHEDPVMMVQVMKIAHYDFNGLFSTLNFGQILAMALISFSFQTNRLLVPFLANWAIPHKKKILDGGYEQWLFIAWQFGFEDDYLKLSKHLATHCKVDEEGQLLSLAGNTVLTGHFPKDALCKQFNTSFANHSETTSR